MINSTLSQSSDDLPSSLTDHYPSLQSAYQESRYTHSVDKLARIITKNPELFENFRFQPIYETLKSAINTLMLNPLELSILAFLLKETPNYESSISAEFFFLFSGFQVKKYLKSDPVDISTYLESKHPGFNKAFSDWESQASSISLTSKQIYDIYNYYSALPEDSKNYNSYVDEILKSSPPCQIIRKPKENTKKKHKRKRKQEESSEEFYVFNDRKTDIEEIEIYGKIDRVLNNHFEAIDIEEIVRGTSKSAKKNLILYELSVMT